MPPDATLRESTADSMPDDGPVVGARLKAANTYVIAGFFAAMAVVLFLMLNGQRGAQSATLVKPDAVALSAAPAPPPLDVPAPPAPPPPPAPPAPEPLAAAPVPAPPPLAPEAVIPADMEQRLHAPAVVVDLQSAQAPTPATPAHGLQSALLASNTASPAGPPGADAESEEVAAPENAGGGSAASAAATMTAPKPSLATRVSGTLPEPAIATQLSGLSRIITQGATIQGVLETALNSDLPGYTRAVVSRDVRSFDGKAVLIP